MHLRSLPVRGLHETLCVSGHFVGSQTEELQAMYIKVDLQVK